MKCRKTILIVSPHAQIKLSKSPDFGLERRVSYLARAISDKYKVIIIEPDDAAEKGQTKNIRFNSLSFIRVKNMRLGSLLLDFNPSYAFKLAKVVRKEMPSAIIVSAHFGIPITWFITKVIYKLNPIIIYNSHNFEAEYARISLEDVKLPRIIKKIYHYYTIFVEKIATRLSDYIFAVSEKDGTQFVKNYSCPPEKILYMPTGADIKKIDSYHSESVSKRTGDIWAVFHGTYRATHNREAIDIIQTYLAKKFEKCQNLKFIVAGKGVPPIEKENVRSVGFVEDLSMFLSYCDIAIVPLQRGEGTKLKIFDYMAAGLPIITTKKGAEGLNLVNGKHAIITDNVDEEFVKAIEYLVKNPKIRKKLGNNARDLLETEYHPEKIKIKINNALEKMIEGKYGK